MAAARDDGGGAVSGADAMGLIQQERAAAARATVVAPTPEARAGKHQPQAGAATMNAEQQAKAAHDAEAQKQAAGEAAWAKRAEAMEARLAVLDREARANFKIADAERQRARELQEQLLTHQQQAAEVMGRMQAEKEEREWAARAQAGEVDPRDRQIHEMGKVLAGMRAEQQETREYLRRYATAQEESRIQSQVDAAVRQHPDVDRDVLLARKFANPNLDIMEIAQAERARIEAAERRIEAKLIERAKARSAQARVVPSGSNVSVMRRNPEINLASQDPREKRKVHDGAREALQAAANAAKG